MTTREYLKIKVNRLRKLAFHMLTFNIKCDALQKCMETTSQRCLSDIKYGINEVARSKNKTLLGYVILHADLTEDNKVMFTKAFDNIPNVRSALLNNQPTKDILDIFQPIEILVDYIRTSVKRARETISDLHETEIQQLGVGTLINCVDNQLITILLDNLETQVTNIELCKQLFDIVVVKSVIKPNGHTNRVLEILEELCCELQSMRLTILSDSTEIWDTFKYIYVSVTLSPSPETLDSIIFEQYHQLDEVVDDHRFTCIDYNNFTEVDYDILTDW